MTTTFSLTIFGSASATPVHGRHPTAQILNVHDSLYLIDCGEGTQMRFNDFRVKRGRLSHIFISHLHGDHFYGLFGLLGTLSLGGRKDPMYIFGPRGIRECFEVVLRHSANGEPMPFDIVWHEIDNTDTPYMLFENAALTVTTIPLQHRIPTVGYLFKEKPLPRNIIATKITEYDINYTDIINIKNGKDYTLPNGTIIPNGELTTPPPAPRTYAYCSDTMYVPSNVPQLAHVDLLYHEATFTAADADRTERTGHSTAAEAAAIAKAADVKRLIIGHFSSRYIDLQPSLLEAKAVFERTELAEEGRVFEV